jgi:hypothetical protein
MEFAGARRFHYMEFIVGITRPHLDEIGVLLDELILLDMLPSRMIRRVPFPKADGFIARLGENLRKRYCPLGENVISPGNLVVEKDIALLGVKTG